MNGGRIIFIAGMDGDGKTKQVLTFPEGIALLDTEFPKAQVTIDEFYKDSFNDGLITVFPGQEYYQKSNPTKNIKRGQLDVAKTYSLILKNVDEINDNMENYETIVIDGISDIKRIFTKYWIMTNPFPNGKPRTSIGENNLGARSEINGWLKDLVLFPLIHTARMLDKTLILTSKMKDEYSLVEGDDGKKHNMKTGEKEIDASDFVGFKMDIKILLSCDKNKKYWLHWLRAPKDGLPAKENITDKKLFDVMMERKLI